MQKELKESTQICNWHNLPCLIINEDAIIFSYTNNSLVASRIPYNKLWDKDTYQDATNKHLFDYITEDTHIVDVPVKQLTLCLTEKCNCKCKYCFLDANTSGQVMTTDTIRKAIEFGFKLYRDHTIVLSAFGGEPGTQEKLIRFFVEYANSIKDHYNVKLQFAITTNGIITDSLIGFLSDNQFVCSISADGIEKVQNFHRPLANGGSTYNHVIQTIQSLVKRNVTVKIRSTVTQYSVSHMVDAVKLYGKLGVEQIHFEPVTIAGRAISQNSLLSPPDVAIYGNELLKCIHIAKNYNTHINFSFGTRCTGSIKNKLIIGANGFISSCVEVQNEAHQYSEVFKIGSIDKTEELFCRKKEFLDINSTAASAEKCKSCPFIIFCHYTCPIRNYRTTGDVRQTDPYKCALYKQILPKLLYDMYEKTFVNN